MARPAQPVHKVLLVRTAPMVQLAQPAHKAPPVLMGLTVQPDLRDRKV